MNNIISIKDFIKGFIIGISVVIPGLSGGTVAVLLGIYEDILNAVSNIKSEFFKSFKYLFWLSIGGIMGMLLILRPIKYFCNSFPQISKCTFCAISLISAVSFARNSIIGKFDKIKIKYAFTGLLTSVLISILLRCANLYIDTSFIMLLIIGFPLALALVLPGISFSYMLLFLGIYEKTLSAFSEFDISFIFPFASGLIFGIWIFSKILLKTINKHPQKTYSFVLGFVICSLVDILL